MASTTFNYDLVLLILVMISWTQIKMTSSTCDDTKGCFPAVIDALENLESYPARSLSASSICGQNGPEQYMTFLKSDFTTYECADSSIVTSSKMADGDTSTYWQSSIGNEPQFVEARFTDVFLLYELLVSFAVPHLEDPDNSADARPPAWSVEKLDDDNVTWVPLRHYAKDCATSFPGLPILDPFEFDYNVVYCQQYEEVDETLEFFDADNQIFYYPGILDVHSPFAYKNDPDVAKYFATTAVRLSFTGLDRGVAKQSYVAISEIVLDVRCQCNGHAEICNGPNGATCQCQHSTTGQQCDSCLPLYNNQPWEYGTTSSAGACQECSCNQHSDACVYDQAKSFGVCQACQDNTAGDACDTCAAGFYINSTWASANDTSKGGDYCLPCACNEAGTTVGQLNTCDVNSGQCTCKTNVQGRDCGECKDTFFGLDTLNTLGCRACVCESAGTIGDNSMCNKTDGACLCRANVQGVSCNTCKPNTYGFNGANVDGCLDCACDAGGSQGQSCDLTSGQCVCRSNIGSRDCTVPNGGSFVPKVDLIILEPEMTATEGLVLRAGHGTPEAAISGRGLVSITSANQIDLDFTAGYNGLMDMAVRYQKTSDNNLIFLESTLTLNSAQSYSCGDVAIEAGQTWTLTKTEVHNEPAGTIVLGEQVCLGEGASYSIQLSNSGAALMVDSIVFLPTLDSLKSSAGQMNTQEIDNCYQDAVETVSSNREACKDVEYSLMAAYLDGALACSCASGSVSTSICDPYSGDCVCNTGVLPPKCDVCSVEAYQFSQQTGCIACQCHVNGSVNTFCDNQGVCECLDNVQGNKCDSCNPDHYGLHTGEGCTPCLCNPTYSEGTGCDDYGQCVCKTGVGGIACDQCDHGHYNLTPEGCTSCGCDPKGSSGIGCDQVTGVCQCRENVNGSACTDCKTGYFGLGEWHSGGCIPCFCWDRGDICQSAPDVYDNHIKSTSASWPDGWTAANGTGTQVGVSVEVKDTIPWLKLDLTENAPYNIHFLAPSKFLLDKSSSYGRSLALTASTTPVDTTATIDDSTTTTIPIYILFEGMYAEKVLRYSASVVAGSTQTFSIALSESSWEAVDKASVDDATSFPQATFNEMMQVLTHVSAFRILAYNTQVPDYQLILRTVTLASGSTGPLTSTLANNMEMCECQSGYGGHHCELCVDGYTRVTPNNQDPSTECVVCNCNGHAKQECNKETGACSTVPCDPVSGVCQCADNTEGDHCEMCKAGYYGDPTKGNPDDCLPCGCPGIIVNNEVNVFAQTCETNEQGAPMCINCTEGHKGDHCEICEDGYFGTPENVTNAGGSCLPCVCNERADTCNPRTGECVDCRNDTSGQECDVCAPGYFGDAMTFSCQECVCKDYPGSTGNCNPSTGQCECLPNVVGNLCDQCQDTAFNLQPQIGCDPCNCHEDGSTSAICDKTTGNCPCRNLVEGRQCDSCQDSFWNINKDTGCDPCSCNELGTAKNGSEIIPTCDVISGQCQCGLPGTIGRTCDACSPVTTFEFEFVQLFYLGSFPQCELCGECFDSWGVTIDSLGMETKGLDDTTSSIWALYGDQQPEEIKVSLSVTEEKIQKASESVGSFETMAQDLAHLQDRFGKAKVKDGVLSTRADSLADKQADLREQLAAIEALTDLIQMTASTTTTVATLQGEMTSLMATSQASINKGNSAWEDIETLKFVVADPADREKQLRSQADASMTIAKLANETLKLADILYKNNLKPTSEDNTGELSSATQKQSEASSKLTSVLETADDVTTTIANIRTSLTSLVGSADQSLEATSKMVEDLKEFWTDASSAKQQSLDALETAEDFLTQAQESEKTMRNSLTAMLENLAALTEAQTNLVSSGQQSARVMAVTLNPVSDLEAIMADIKSTSVSSADVQAVNLKAQKALFVAEDALEDTQKALGLAREVNQEVTIMEEDIQASKTSRTEAQGLKAAADMISNGIDAIVLETEEYINQTIADIKEVTSSSQIALENITTISQCLDQGQLRVTDATTSAGRAEERAQTTIEHQQTLLQLMLDVNQESGDQTVSKALNSLSQGSSLLSQVIQDREQVEAITDLEALVQDLVAQILEINTLESEINALTSELDDLVLSLEENLDGGSCNA